MKGNSFDMLQLGIWAQIQYLKAYASKDSLKNTCIDSRFKYVTRCCAEYVEWLGQQENPQGKGWAAGAGYGENENDGYSVFDKSGKVLYKKENRWRLSRIWCGYPSLI